jgi:transposase
MQRLPDPVQKVNAYVLGMDVHKRRTVWVLLDRKGHRVAEGEIMSRPAALEDLYRRIIGRKKAHVAFEASGGCLWVFDTCRRLMKGADRIHVAHAKSVKSIANSTQKNDRNDAWWLAYLTFEGRLPEAWLPREKWRELRIATRERTAYVRERTRLVKRIHAHLRQAGKPLAKGALKNPNQREALREVFPTLDRVTRRAIVDGLAHYEELTRHIETWERQIARMTKEDLDVRDLEGRIPGMGPILAPTILAESGPLSRFYKAKAYARYTGLTPSERSSAGVTRHGRLAKEGNPNLRWALNQAITACLRARRGPGLAVGNWVRRREKRLGSRKKAKCAAARKLAEAIWRLFALGEDFELERIFGHAPREAEPAA